MNNETEKDVVGYEGLYKINSNGVVFNIKNKEIMPHFVNRYKRVSLHKNNRMRSYLVHRLVAIAFLDNVIGKTHVNHKNLNRSDNRLENLEWCTAKENTEHAANNGVALGRSKGKNGKIYLKIRDMLAEGMRIMDIKNALGTTYQTVSNIKYGVSHKYLNVKQEIDCS